MEITEYIFNEALILIPVLWIIGTYLKMAPQIPNWIIPWILTCVGVIGSIGIMGLSVDAVVQGILVSGAAVLGHQLLKQTKERK